MAAFYDARGNTYFVASPEEIGGFTELPQTATEPPGRASVGHDAPSNAFVAA